MTNLKNDNQLFWVRLDFWCQSVLIILLEVCLVCSIPSYGSIFIFALIFQFFIGTFQYLISGLINMMSNRSGKLGKYRQIHFYISTIVLLVFLMSLTADEFIYLKSDILFALFIIIPQILMWFYYYITSETIKEGNKS